MKKTDEPKIDEQPAARTSVRGAGMKRTAEGSSKEPPEPAATPRALTDAERVRQMAEMSSDILGLMLRTDSLMDARLEVPDTFESTFAEVQRDLIRKAAHLADRAAALGGHRRMATDDDWLRDSFMH